MKPLATSLRPTTIDDIIGQTNLLQPDGLIRRMVEKKFVTNLIFYGPPGVGKTSFASALAADLGYETFMFNASIDKKDKIDKILANPTEAQRILIIDEVHRMNQNKQDILLEHMENGQIICFFTTTENPYFTINPAIRSRSTILELLPISDEDIFNYLQAKIAAKEIDLKIDDENLNLLTQMSSGDLRVAINKVELLLNLYPGQEIDGRLVKRIFDSKANLPGSKRGDIHHYYMSALQKSVRGSDVDASLYWMARMLETGDYEALMRRMMVMSYEDVGLANPAVPVHVFTACQTFRQVGMPEGVIPLGLVVVEMALSEKSNSAYKATEAALSIVKNGANYDVPEHLKPGVVNHGVNWWEPVNTRFKNKPKPLAKNPLANRGVDYKYPHDYPQDYVEQQYLPDEIKDVRFYHPKLNSAYERRVYEYYKNFTKKNLD